MGSGGGVGRYKCEECGKCYARRDGLRRHERYSHDPGGKETEKVFKCPSCPAAWEKQFMLNRHFRLVHEKKYKCILPDTLVDAGWPQCGAAFGKDTALWYHICRYHKEIRPKKFLRDMMAGASADNHDAAPAPPSEPAEDDGKAICPFENCDTQFTHQPILLRHLQQHVRCPFACVCCGERFALVKLLTEHYRDRSNACTKPKKARSAKVQSSADVATNPSTPSKAIGEQQRWLCEQCPRVFTRKCNLQAHVKAVHLKEIKFVCEFCSYQTPRRFAYERHVAREKRALEAAAASGTTTPKSLWKSVPLVEELNEDDATCLEHHVLDTTDSPRQRKRRRRQLFDGEYPSTADIDTEPVVLIEAQPTPSDSADELVVLIETDTESLSASEVTGSTAEAATEELMAESEAEVKPDVHAPAVELVDAPAASASPIDVEPMSPESQTAPAEEVMQPTVEEDISESVTASEPGQFLFGDSTTEQDDDEVAPSGVSQSLRNAASEPETSIAEALIEPTQVKTQQIAAHDARSPLLACLVPFQPPGDASSRQSTPVSSRPSSPLVSRQLSPLFERPPSLAPSGQSSPNSSQPNSPHAEPMDFETSASPRAHYSHQFFEESDRGEKSPRFDYLPQTPRISDADRQTPVSVSAAIQSATSSEHTESRKPTQVLTSEPPVSAPATVVSENSGGCCAADEQAVPHASSDWLVDVTSSSSMPASALASQVEEVDPLMREESEAETPSYPANTVSASRTESETPESTETRSERALFSDLLASVEKIHAEQTQAELARLAAQSIAVPVDPAEKDGEVVASPSVEKATSELATATADEASGNGSVDTADTAGEAEVIDLPPVHELAAHKQAALAQAQIIADLFSD